MQIGNINYSQFSKMSALSFKGETEPIKAESAKVASTPAQALSEPAKTTVSPAATEKDAFVKAEEPQVVEKPKSSITGKIGKAAMSLIPGLGQYANGQYIKTALYPVGTAVLATTGFLLCGKYGLIAAGLLYLYNIYDAYKNA